MVSREEPEQCTCSLRVEDQRRPMEAQDWQSLRYGPCEVCNQSIACAGQRGMLGKVRALVAATLQAWAHPSPTQAYKPV